MRLRAAPRRENRVADNGKLAGMNYSVYSIKEDFNTGVALVMCGGLLHIIELRGNQQLRNRLHALATAVDDMELSH
jgi:hypothetical protein